MGILDYKERARGKAPTPEKRVFGNWLARVSSEGFPHVIKMAEENHEHFKDRFPTLAEFQDVAAETWVERMRVFEDEMRLQGFEVVQPGTKASILNDATLAIITLGGSHVFIGPGAFVPKAETKPVRGASVLYSKIDLRRALDIPQDVEQPNGFAFAERPQVGKRILPRINYDQELRAPFAQTSPVAIFMMRRSSSPEDARAIIKNAQSAVTQRFNQVDQKAGLVLARPKN